MAKITLNQELGIKNQRVAVLGFVLIIIAIFFVGQRLIGQPKTQEPVVRDEFIEQLVAEATQPYPLVVTGRKFYEQGELERAQKLFKKATLLDRDYRDAFYHLGITELALGNLNRAFYALLRAKSIDPLYKPTYEVLIRIYERKGETAKVQELKMKSEKL